MSSTCNAPSNDTQIVVHCGGDAPEQRIGIRKLVGDECRVFHIPGESVGVEVTPSVMPKAADHYMKIPSDVLTQYRRSAFNNDDVCVFEIVDHVKFLSSLDFVNNGELREAFGRAIAEDWHGPMNKQNKAKKFDAVNMLRLNSATYQRIADNIKAGNVYEEFDSESDKRVIEEYFLERPAEKRGLGITSSKDLPAGFLVAEGFGGLDKSSNSCCTHVAGKESTLKRKVEDLEAEIAGLRKVAKWIHAVTHTTSGQVTLHLNLVKQDGEEKNQMVVTADPLFTGN